MLLIAVSAGTMRQSAVGDDQVQWSPPSNSAIEAVAVQEVLAADGAQFAGGEETGRWHAAEQVADQPARDVRLMFAATLA